MAKGSSKANPPRPRKRVEADANTLKRARDGSAFTRWCGPLFFVFCFSILSPFALLLFCFVLFLYKSTLISYAIFIKVCSCLLIDHSDACNKDVAVVLIDMHSCSLDSKIKMTLGKFSALIA